MVEPGAARSAACAVLRGAGPHAGEYDGARRGSVLSGGPEARRHRHGSAACNDGGVCRFRSPCGRSEWVSRGTGVVCQSERRLAYPIIQGKSCSIAVQQIRTLSTVLFDFAGTAFANCSRGSSVTGGMLQGAGRSLTHSMPARPSHAVYSLAIPLLNLRSRRFSTTRSASPRWPRQAQPR